MPIQEIKLPPAPRPAPRIKEIKLFDGYEKSAGKSVRASGKKIGRPPQRSARTTKKKETNMRRDNLIFFSAIFIVALIITVIIAVVF